jgi:hypothetical protein
VNVSSLAFLTSLFSHQCRYIKEWWNAQYPFESLGSLNLLRADLAARHNGETTFVVSCKARHQSILHVPYEIGEQVWIKGKDGRKIDCMLLQTRAAGIHDFPIMPHLSIM